MSCKLLRWGSLGALLGAFELSWRSLGGSLGLFWGSAGVDGVSKITPICALMSKLRLASMVKPYSL